MIAIPTTLLLLTFLLEFVYVLMSAFAPENWNEVTIWADFWKFLVLLQALLSLAAVITSLILLITKKFPTVLAGLCITALSTACFAIWTTWTIDWFF